MLIRTNVLNTVCAALLSIGLLSGCGQDETSQQNTPDGENASQDESGHGHGHEGGHSHDDEHDIPLTDEEIATLKAETAKYTDAITHIQKFQKEIETEVASDEPAKAHRPLDNLDVVLERLPEAAKNSNVPEDKLQEVKDTAQTLRDLFNQVHANLDEGKDADYGSVADEISKGIESLTAIEPAENE